MTRERVKTNEIGSIVANGIEARKLVTNKKIRQIMSFNLKKKTKYM